MDVLFPQAATNSTQRNPTLGAVHGVWDSNRAETDGGLAVPLMDDATRWSVSILTSCGKELLTELREAPEGSGESQRAWEGLNAVLRMILHLCPEEAAHA